MKAKPPIQLQAQQLLFEVEAAVRHFPRYHKYTLGSEMRLTALRIMQCIQRALSRKSKRRMVQRLSETIDDMKTQVLLAKQLGCYGSKHTFSRLTELVVNLGKQSGGWLKRLTKAEFIAHGNEVT